MLIKDANASKNGMRGHFISLLLIFAVLFGSTHVSALAHSHIADAEQSLQIEDVDHHAFVVSDDGDSDSKRPLERDIGQHHHCSSLLAIEPDFPCKAHLAVRSRVFPAAIKAMASLSSAPPTQPPSA